MPFAVALLAAVGIVTIWPTALSLWALWVTDPLKSIGMLVPIASLFLILRAWRSIAWQTEGTWWGLALLLATALTVYIREHAVVVLVVAPQWNVYFPPNSLVAFSYVAGVVLLIGGPRLFRAALFPIFLVLLVNPVPHIFNVFVDLPLQRVSAHVARAFAHALGQPLSPDQMRLMFTPSFGMFIAPGCNGIRGAVTMGMIALIVGYLYRFRASAHAAFVVAAILLGYLFNFLRLCTLVLYYILALHLPSLQPHGEGADYIIGACLFLFATFLLTYIVRHAQNFTRPEPISSIRQHHRSHSPESGGVQPKASAGSADRRVEFPGGSVGTPAMDGEGLRRVAGVPGDSVGLQPHEIPHSAKKRASAPALWARLAAMALLCAFCAISMSRAYASAAKSAPQDVSVLGTFPTQVGAYTLARSWNEYATGGPVIFQWADYAPADGSAHIAVGISPILGSHDTLICHSARGEDPIWHAELPVNTAGGPTSFSASFFADGATQYLEATTLCQGASCGEYSDNRRHFGFVYSRPSASTLFSQDPERPLPVMLRAETTDTALPADLARQQLTDSTRSFLAHLNLNELTRPYRRQP